MLTKELKKQKTGHSEISHAGRLAYYIANILMPASPSGFTLNPMTLQTPVLNKYKAANTYFVSLKGYEQQFQQQPVFAEVSEWVNKYNRLLHSPGYYIGGWLDAGIYYLDLSVAIRGRAKALRIAHVNEQRAIFHPSSDKTIYVPNKLPIVA